MSREVRDYSSDNTNMLNKASDIKSGGGFKMARDEPMHPVTSKKAQAKEAPQVNPKVSTQQNTGTPMKMGSGVSADTANGDMAAMDKGGMFVDTNNRRSFSNRGQSSLRQKPTKRKSI